MTYKLRSNSAIASKVNREYKWLQLKVEAAHVQPLPFFFGLAFEKHKGRNGFKKNVVIVWYKRLQ